MQPSPFNSRLFTALYFLVFLFGRCTRRENRERTGRQRKTEDFNGASLLSQTPPHPGMLRTLFARFFLRVRK